VFRLVDLAEVLTAHRKRILRLTLGAAALAAVVSLILPPWFRSETTILGQEEVSESRRMLTQLRSLSIPGVRQDIGLSSPETFLAILESRRLREAVIARFELKSVYRTKRMDDALREFARHVSVVLEETGVIRVRVEDRDRDRSAAIAGAMIEELDRINVEIRIYRARRARQYLERQLQDVRSSLAASEDSLARFQEQHLLISLDEQAKAAVEAAAALQAKAVELRIKRGLLLRFAAESNLELRAVTHELAEVESQILEMERGTGERASFARIPGLGMRLAQLLRDTKVGEMVLAMLTENYEEARLDEAKDTPVVQVLDRAVPADRKARPKRAVIVASTTAVAFLLALAASVAEDRYRALASPADKRRWRAVGDTLIRWIRPRARASS
jgi:uncharacterized protein involved in exopolysaccharide biosynthesis